MERHEIASEATRIRCFLPPFVSITNLHLSKVVLLCCLFVLFMLQSALDRLLEKARSSKAISYRFPLPLVHDLQYGVNHSSTLSQSATHSKSRRRRMKDTLMQQSTQEGLVKREDAIRMFKVDPLKTDAVYDLLVSKGWIEGEPAAPARTGSAKGGSKSGVSVTPSDTKDAIMDDIVADPAIEPMQEDPKPMDDNEMKG
jgi:hypothetical protein